jgi:hypothetical protein
MVGGGGFSERSHLLIERSDGQQQHQQQQQQQKDRDEHEQDRHLTLFDGSGVFVLIGLIARTSAGPAVFVSWAIAGVAAAISGLCYAELGMLM